jgi:hypothetical protein
MKRVINDDDPLSFGAKQSKAAAQQQHQQSLKSNLEMQESGESLELLDEFEYLMVSLVAELPSYDSADNLLAGRDAPRQNDQSAAGKRMPTGRAL